MAVEVSHYTFAEDRVLYSEVLGALNEVFEPEATGVMGKTLASLVALLDTGVLSLAAVICCWYASARERLLVTTMVTLES